MKDQRRGHLRIGMNQKKEDARGEEDSRREKTGVEVQRLGGGHKKKKQEDTRERKPEKRKPEKKTWELVIRGSRLEGKTALGKMILW